MEGLVELATLQTRVSRRVRGKEYVKSDLVIPRELVQKLSWSDDQTINFRLHGSNKLLLIPTEPRQRPVKLAFETFAATVLRVLAEHPQGLAWSRIRELGELEQATPNPVWVYRLEKECGLERSHDKALQVLWRLKL
jgi:antitoxin component of MazEF toxin-antitoxin module